MRFSVFSLVMLMASFAFVLPARAQMLNSTKVTCKELYRELYAHSEGAMKDGEQGTDYFYWGRARLAIEATPAESLEKIFRRMSKKDLEQLFFDIKSGDVVASRQEEKMVEELWHMVDDLGEKTFWGPTTDRGFTIREALRKHDAKLSYSGDPAYAAEMTDKSLGKTELEVMARALAEHEKNQKYPNSKWYDRVVRFFSPHFDKVSEVLAANNSIRRRLQKMYEIDKPALDAIPKFKDELKLTPAELKELQNQVSDTGGQLNEARQDIQNLYGREVSVMSPLAEREIRIRDLAKKAKASETTKKESDLGSVAEADMDTIDRVVGGAWNRTKQTTTGMPVTEKHDVHLEIRNPQYRRETPEKRAAYQSVTEPRSPDKAEYNVKTEWTYTVNYEEQKTRQVAQTTTNDKGETTTEWVTEQYTEYWSETFSDSRADVLRARYEEVLNNRVNPSDHMSDLPPLPSAPLRGMHAVSSYNNSPSIGWSDTTRTNWILEQGKYARKSEEPYRSQIAHATNLIDGITNDAYKAALKKPGEVKKMNSAVNEEIKTLQEKRAELVAYQKQDSGAVYRQWQQDKETDYRDRNRQMLERFDHMIKRAVHLAEQLRRENPSLLMEFNLPDYQPQLQRLEAIKKKNKKIIVGTTAGTAAAAAAPGGYVYRSEILNGIRELTGNAPVEPEPYDRMKRFRGEEYNQ